MKKVFGILFVLAMSGCSSDPGLLIGNKHLGIGYYQGHCQAQYHEVYKRGEVACIHNLTKETYYPEALP